jgi:pimeloyl-ACP methyl ester carboxylesterase
MSRLVDVHANGLDHRVVEWEPTEATKPPVVLVHGFMDAAGTFETVAPALARAGHRVLAPHMRGFGHAPRAPEGSYYHFPDYVADLAEIVEALLGEASFYLVGHSMGGTVASYFAGAFPERVEKLALLEGTGPPDNPHEVAPLRMRRWIEEVRATREKKAKSRTSPEDALARLERNHRGVPREVLEGRVGDLIAQTASGEHAWLFDPLHRTVSPMPFFAASYKEFAKRVTCPVLAVDGGSTGFEPPDQAERLGSFVSLRRATLEGAGHMMHWTRPDELARVLLEFFTT